MWFSDSVGYDTSRTLGDLPSDLVLDTGQRFGQHLDPEVVQGLLLDEERRFGELIRRGQTLLPRLYPSGQLTEQDYFYLHDTHGLPRELVEELMAT